jgi:hypothetical protein
VDGAVEEQGRSYQESGRLVPREDDVDGLIVFFEKVFI